MSEGFLFVCSDDQLMAEAEQSAKRIKSVMEDYPVCLITDDPSPVEVFDEHVHIDDLEAGFVDKVNHMHRTPFEKTVFLDTDTYINQPVPELFDLLDQVELAAAASPHRVSPENEFDVPRAFPAYNTGVIAFHLCSATESFFEQWRNKYVELLDEGIEADQASFRPTLYNSEVSHSTLPSEYNCRSIHPGYLHDKVKIIHARHINYEYISKTLNRTTKKRVHYRRHGQLVVKTNTERTLVERAYNAWLRFGLKGVLERVGARLLPKLRRLK
jgi:NADH:ubiquinone oxidoreductase subunit